MECRIIRFHCLHFYLIIWPKGLNSIFASFSLHFSIYLVELRTNGWCNPQNISHKQSIDSSHLHCCYYMLLFSILFTQRSIYAHFIMVASLGLVRILFYLTCQFSDYRKSAAVIPLKIRTVEVDECCVMSRYIISIRLAITLYDMMT